MTVAIVGIIGLCSICNRNKLRPIKEDNNRTLAMSVENEAGEYVISSDSEFPTEGYVLDHAECKNGGSVTQNSTTKKMSIKITDSDSCNLYFAKEATSAEILIAKANDVTITDYENGNKGEMYTFAHNDLTTTTEYIGTTYTHSATQVANWTEEERTDYRYIGANPNNWVKFNDEDWRIIGVFTVETSSGSKEQLIKIIRNESIGNMSWDDYTDGSSTNEWSTASLKTMLNGEYYSTANSFDYTYKTSSTSAGTTVTIPKGLSITSQNQIEEVKWYLGGISEYDASAPDYYNFERGETVYTEHSTSTTAKVGLMYPSDYTYTYANGVDNICYTNGHNCSTGQPTNGWLYDNTNTNTQWTISPYATNDFAFLVSGSGFVYISSYADYTGEKVYLCLNNYVRPVVYLQSNIKIVSGDGTSSNPYILG